MMAAINFGALLEYGRPQGVLRCAGIGQVDRKPCCLCSGNLPLARPLNASPLVRPLDASPQHVAPRAPPRCVASTRCLNASPHVRPLIASPQRRGIAPRMLPQRIAPCVPPQRVAPSLPPSSDSFAVVSSRWPLPFSNRTCGAPLTGKRDVQCPSHLVRRFSFSLFHLLTCSPSPARPSLLVTRRPLFIRRRLFPSHIAPSRHLIALPRRITRRASHDCIDPNETRSSPPLSNPPCFSPQACNPRFMHSSESCDATDD